MDGFVIIPKKPQPGNQTGLCQLSMISFKLVRQSSYPPIQKLFCMKQSDRANQNVSAYALMSEECRQGSFFNIQDGGVRQPVSCLSKNKQLHLTNQSRLVAVWTAANVTDDRYSSIVRWNILAYFPANIETNSVYHLS